MFLCCTLLSLPGGLLSALSSSPGGEDSAWGRAGLFTLRRS